MWECVCPPTSLQSVLKRVCACMCGCVFNKASPSLGFVEPLARYSPQLHTHNHSLYINGGGLPHKVLCLYKLFGLAARASEESCGLWRQELNLLLKIGFHDVLRKKKKHIQIQSTASVSPGSDIANGE